jgi:uncharacterized protein with ParB-like and HNH nuclease domain
MDLITIDRLLKFGIFKIPDYQRGYSWGKIQLFEFIEDLEDVKNVNEHYTGTITLLKSGDEKIGISPFQIFDVVDGQQRLITIHLLLSCIYYRAKRLGNDDTEIIRHIIYKGKTLLRLNSQNQDFYTYLLNEDNIENIRKIEFKNKTQKNLLFAKEFLTKHLAGKSLKKIETLYKHLLTKFKVNIFEVSNENEVGLIFETMNDRGLPLSDIDKVKNYIIYICHRFDNNILAKDTNRRFGEIFNELIKVEFFSNVLKAENHFLKNAYLIYTGDTKDLNDIHKKIKNNLITKYASEKKRDLFTSSTSGIEKKQRQIKEFNSFLTKAAKEYSKLFNCTYESTKINEMLFRLKMLDYLDTFIPVLLAVATNKKYKLSHLEKIVEILEIYALRIFGIENKKSNSGMHSLNEIAFNIKSNKTKFNQVKKDIRDLMKKYSDGNSFRRSIIKEQSYDKKSTNVIKYFLYEYELYISEIDKNDYKMPSFIDFYNNSEKDFTIEHIAPQTPLPGSKEILNLHSLGNLVLTKTNKRLDNKLFEQKKKIFLVSELSSEKELTKYNLWNDKTINERGSKLANFAKNRWRIN